MGIVMLAMHVVQMRNNFKVLWADAVAHMTEVIPFHRSQSLPNQKGMGRDRFFVRSEGTVAGPIERANPQPAITKVWGCLGDRTFFDVAPKPLFCAQANPSVHPDEERIPVSFPSPIMPVAHSMGFMRSPTLRAIFFNGTDSWISRGLAERNSRWHRSNSFGVKRAAAATARPHFNFILLTQQHDDEPGKREDPDGDKYPEGVEHYSSITER